MDSVWGWLGDVLATSAVSAALLALAGFLGKSHLAHWLNRDIERLKAEHQRALEAYKVSLISEAERAKAETDLKRNAAIKILEKEFAALNGLHKAVAGIHARLGAIASLSPEGKTEERWQEAVGRMNALTDASDDVQIFLSMEEARLVINLGQALMAYYHRCQPGRPALTEDEATVTFDQVHALDAAVKEMTRAKLNAMRLGAGG